MKALVALTAAVIAFAVPWMSPLGGERPRVRTESAKGLSQLDAVIEAEKKKASKKVQLNATRPSADSCRPPQ